MLWCDTARYPQLFGIDARALFPFSLWAFHWAKWTFIIAAISVLFFWLLTRRGYSPEVFIRYARNLIIRGERTVVDPVVYRRRCRW